eukprot:jgi/Chrzof1/12360/Cz06g31240.t1
MIKYRCNSLAGISCPGSCFDLSLLPRLTGLQRLNMDLRRCSTSERSGQASSMCLPSSLTSLELTLSHGTGLYDQLIPTVKLGALSNLRELELYEYGTTKTFHHQQSPWQHMVQHLGMLTKLGLAIRYPCTSQPFCGL